MEEKNDNKIGHSSKDIAKSGFLAGNHIVFVFKKIERLSSALYLLTNLWNDLEPLKWSIRQKNLDLIGEASRYHYEHLLSRAEVTNKLLSRVGEIVSLLEIAFSASLLSDMNLRILRDEYIYLVRVLKEKEDNFVTLPKGFFSEPLFEERIIFAQMFRLPGQERTRGFHKGHKGHIKDIVPEMSFNKKTRPLNKEKIIRINGAGARYDVIFNLVKNMGEITIKDAVSVIKDCSEKTIQRELISMTKSGLLKKSGERRWSKYSLA